jgi:RimJ/RimL family protein N-acetyltransferase
MDWAFANPNLTEIVSYTVPANAPSRRVMEKLGLERAAGRNFDHPAIPEGNPLRQHILYRVTRSAWLRRA